MNNSLETVEVLKGSQSTLYGSGAIAGAINLYTKKGKEGHHQTGAINIGSFGTHNTNLSYDGKKITLIIFLKHQILVQMEFQLELMMMKKIDIEMIIM